ncbi:aminodeoxychorismate/anthranilate synthase component II [Candidatus Peregrinibacteria bacterium]|nr:aminodeoxychorismate/anthranilate synthase component II [Candidatus Peregrinibacteria bacterium]
MKTLIIDNYDSFTYNLAQYFGELNANPVVHTNDSLSVEKINSIDPTHIVISPGPGTVEKSEDFGICEQAILTYMDKLPILGVCLGHQGIAKALGGKITSAPTIMHGKKSIIEHTNEGIFQNIKNPFTAMRYHSLCIDETSLPSELTITARAQDDNTIQAIQHDTYPLFGIQFHPESFGTPEGKTILSNFLRYG